MSITIKIDHCASCSEHNWNTRHNQGAYRGIATELKNQIQTRVQDVIVEIRARNSLENKILIGAFEVSFKGIVLFSKQQLGYFPSPAQLAERIESFVSEFKSGSDLMKYKFPFSPVKRHLTIDSPAKVRSRTRPTSPYKDPNVKEGRLQELKLKDAVSKKLQVAGFSQRGSNSKNIITNIFESKKSEELLQKGKEVKGQRQSSANHPDKKEQNAKQLSKVEDKQPTTKAESKSEKDEEKKKQSSTNHPDKKEQNAKQLSKVEDKQPTTKAESKPNKVEEIFLQNLTPVKIQKQESNLPIASSKKQDLLYEKYYEQDFEPSAQKVPSKVTESKTVNPKQIQGSRGSLAGKKDSSQRKM